MTDQSSPSRRFQFRLRTLMIVVTLLAVPCAYVGSQAKIVRNRRTMREWLQSHGAMVMTIAVDISTKKRFQPSVSWLREMFGDSGVVSIGVRRPLSSAEEQRLKAAFPEAVVYWFQTDDEQGN